MRALDALKRADVMVYDALVSDRVMALASPEARREFAGKRGGRPWHSQRDVALRLIELARQGQRVLRLKGGDAFVLGRGGEEAGVRFRVAPGITAGLGGPAYAGTPATSRNTNQAVTWWPGMPPPTARTASIGGARQRRATAGPLHGSVATRRDRPASHRGRHGA
ncbi:MAG: uroporphyrinogen-III C-methyltransferase [Roseiarcus sp.]